MSELDSGEAMRQTAREVLRELLPGMLDEVLGRSPDRSRAGTNGSGSGSGRGSGSEHASEVVPLVPAPPVAAVLRPSTWAGPPVPGERIGGGEPADDSGVAAAPPAAAERRDGASGVHVERVTIDSDEDLERFVRALVTRLENPRDRRAVRTGRLRFALHRPPTFRPGGPPGESPGPMMRVGKGAVTERLVREAAAAGAGIMLTRGAVLTPLARDLSRKLRVRIEREG
ncbi:MAG TPA: hypothetical protein VG325_18575 [Solirubrobacteraceae bacterium]|jgi:hypothetical protein|nr:hypothetical protein [Solirubrobacteraceae bacterium]